MSKKRANNLIIIENGQLSTYILDDRLSWVVGRPSKDGEPDIKLYSVTVSRNHGRFQNMDGVWFYIDNNGKNGTIYNGVHLETGIAGRNKPIILSDGDVLIFGGGEQPVINYKTVWAMFSTHYYDERWNVVETRDYRELVFKSGNDTIELTNPDKGTVIDNDNGVAIYMGDVTYMAGDISLSTN